MKRTVFVDTDIILDILTSREPFYQPAARLFTLVERGEIKACVSSLTFANLFYILRKELSSPKAIEVLKKLRQLVTVLAVDDKIIGLALNTGFNDFEDAIQYQTALSKEIAWLITRNIKDYRKPVLTVCTAEEFLASRASA
ncbi:toxin, PIN family [Geotalea daltonii FRC-32]|uniref:Toxin, PIN family n=1 Tax=Geotalea daltonii (strain DSM 22248 / JCM 15807 / FRC-32) TaxID=316067 RepID=B9M6Q8_GEODF|nr:PIN domain-containing protein [Geotalea daltonii]ACM20118.1 toxin, PIN family [Geotalea daltonii FRC-32]